MPPLRHGPLRRRGGVRGQAGPPVVYPLSALRRLRRSGSRHNQAGDHDGRHRRGGEPGGRAVQASGGEDLHPAHHEPGDSHCGGRVRGAGLRHRRGEDDPRPRPQRL